MTQRGLLLFFVFTLFVMVGCKKEILHPADKVTKSFLDFSVNEGILHFNSFDDLLNFISLSANNPEMTKQLLKQKNFVSLKEIQTIALNELNSNDRMDIKVWLDKYNDLFKLVSDKNGDLEVRPVIDNILLSNVVNREKIVEIGDTILGLNEYFVIIGPKSQKENIIDFVKGKGQIKSDNKNIFMYKYNYDKAMNPKKHIAIAISDERGCKRDRKVKIENQIFTLAWIQDGYYFYQIGVKTLVKGYRKRACIWVPYKTQLEYKQVKGQVTYNSSLSTKYFYISSANSLTDTYYLEGIVYLENGITRDRNYINRLLRDVYFLKDYGKASSRGVGNLWAVIDYNF